MKNRVWRSAAIAAIILVTAAVYLAVAVARHGFSAREKPSRVEEFFARHARRIATPSDAKQLRNPYPVTPESLAAAREHLVVGFATCLPLDGSGNTALGRNLYPPAPDMRAAYVQTLADGELYYIITNGVRFTGMPAWGGEHTPEQTWQLVSFIRRLPSLSPEELKQMEELATTGSAAGPAHEAGSKAHRH